MFNKLYIFTVFCVAVIDKANKGPHCFPEHSYVVPPIKYAFQGKQQYSFSPQDNH